jgi:hypothetical protein
MLLDLDEACLRQNAVPRGEKQDKMEPSRSLQLFPNELGPGSSITRCDPKKEKGRKGSRTLYSHVVEHE